MPARSPVLPGHCFPHYFLHQKMRVFASDSRVLQVTSPREATCFNISGCLVCSSPLSNCSGPRRAHVRRLSRASKSRSKLVVLVLVLVSFMLFLLYTFIRLQHSCTGVYNLVQHSPCLETRNVLETYQYRSVSSWLWLFLPCHAAVHGPWPCLHYCCCPPPSALLL